MDKHIFAGNNTEKGFYNYFDHLITSWNLDKIYILKGGPGVGKSSFMKRLAKHFTRRGEYIEYIHCSNDHNSLDGIIIPNQKMAMVDGTAPHIIEPKLPGLIEEILDFSKFLKEENLKKQKSKIRSLTREKTLSFQSGYYHLEIAGLISKIIDQIYYPFFDHDSKHLVESQIISDLNQLLDSMAEHHKNDKKGKIRKAFSEAHTAGGYISYTKNLCKNKLVWSLVNPSINNTSLLLNNLVSILTYYGYDIESYYLPLHPDKLQHIYIKNLNLMIISSQEIPIVESEKVYSFLNCINQDQVDQDELKEYKKLYNLFLEKATNKFKEASQKHDLLEKIYIKNMDFNKVDNLYEEILSRYKD